MSPQINRIQLFEFFLLTVAQYLFYKGPGDFVVLETSLFYIRSLQ